MRATPEEELLLEELELELEEFELEEFELELEELELEETELELPVPGPEVPEPLPQAARLRLNRSAINPGNNLLREFAGNGGRACEVLIAIGLNGQSGE